jgi:hypothetical protein
MGESFTMGSGCLVIVGGLGRGRDNGSGVEELRRAVPLYKPRDARRLLSEGTDSDSTFASSLGGLPRLSSAGSWALRIAEMQSMSRC